MAELAFLRAFLAWEAFLEESFILYLTGHKPPRGRCPRRYSFPPNQNAAREWVLPEGGRDFADWTTAVSVSRRAERFFVDGWPYADLLRSHQSALDESKVIRNAIAHASSNAQAKFEKLVRDKVGMLPPNLTVGGFLEMTLPRSSPPLSFLDHYLAKVEFAACQIVPV